MSKHTPGPWKASSIGYNEWPFEGGYNGKIYAEGGYCIYQGPASFNALRGRSREEAEANAILIASAPALVQRIAELEAKITQLEQAGGWQPVDIGEYGNVLVDSGGMDIGVCYEDDNDEPDVAWASLPVHLRLCQRIEGAQPQKVTP